MECLAPCGWVREERDEIDEFVEGAGWDGSRRLDEGGRRILVPGSGSQGSPVARLRQPWIRIMGIALGAWDRW